VYILEPLILYIPVTLFLHASFPCTTAAQCTLVLAFSHFVLLLQGTMKYRVHDGPLCHGKHPSNHRGTPCALLCILVTSRQKFSGQVQEKRTRNRRRSQVRRIEETFEIMYERTDHRVRVSCRSKTDEPMYPDSGPSRTHPTQTCSSGFGRTSLASMVQGRRYK
jgi:hypothetical protein